MKLLTAEEAMYTCVRCGACRGVCPTLHITGREADGPRGRVLMARSLIEGEIPVNQEIEDQLDRCLLCSACVDACPIDVPVPDIVMSAKEKIQEQKKTTLKWNLWNRVNKFFFERLLPYQKRLQLLGDLMWVYQKSGLRWLVRKLGIVKLLPESMKQMEWSMPEIDSPRTRNRTLPPFTAGWTDTNVEGRADGKHRKDRVAMLQGCIMDVMFRKTNLQSITLLSKSGFDVTVPVEQVCCGALHLHNGYRQLAIQLAKKNIEIFEQLEVDYIISNAGGCGAMLREYEELFRNDPEWLDRARNFSGKIRDISEIVVERGRLPEMVGTGEKVTYQPSCHLQYVMGVKDAPARLIKSVQSDCFVELSESSLCCGSAGIYNMLQPQLANDILDRKMNHVQSTKADLLITANPGCLLQLKAGVIRTGTEDRIKVLHIVDYLMDTIERGEKTSDDDVKEGIRYGTQTMAGNKYF